MSPLKYCRKMPHWMEFVGLVQRRSYGGYLRFAVMAMGATPVLIAIAMDAYRPGVLDPMSVLFGMLAALLFVSVMSQVGTRRYVKASGWILGDREITLTDDGLVDAGNGAVVQASWPAIEGMSVAKGVIVLWMDTAAGIFIPRDAFASPEEEKKFLAFALEHVKA
jgi:hypothetical protein